MRLLSVYKIALLLSALVSLSVFATVPIAPISIAVKQPNGYEFKIYPKGDINREWIETADGKAVSKVNGKWFYLIKASDGSPQISPLAVGELSSLDLKKIPFATDLNFTKAPQNKQESIDIPHPLTLGRSPSYNYQRIESNNSMTEKTVQNGAPAAFTQNILLLRVSFTNQAFKYDAASFEQLMFSGSQSVKDYFLKASHNNYTLVGATESEGQINDGVVSVSLNLEHPNTKYGSTEMVHAAFAAADPYIDYSSFDTNGDNSISAKELSIVLIVAGYENSYGGSSALTPRVWGHKSSVSSVTHDGVTLSPYTMFGERHATSLANEHQATIGIMAHELGHLMLALPDLYDTDGSSSGVGAWGLMGGGSWNYVSGHQGSTPAGMLAWSKDQVNFSHITDASAGATSISSTTLGQTAQRIWIDKYKLGEHFLLENRTDDEYDRGLSNHGLLITHIDPSQSNNKNDVKRLVDVEEADGSNGAGSTSVYPGANNYMNFNSASNPNSNKNDGSVTNVEVNGISLLNGVISINDISMESSTSSHGYLTYMNNATSVSAFGWSNPAAWTALRYTNSTSLTTIDGVQVHSWEAGSADLYIYDSISGNGDLGTLMHSQLNNPLLGGYSRIILNQPYTFPVNSDVVIVLKITLNSLTYPVSFDTSESTSSGRGFVRSGNSGSFYSMFSGYGDLAQYLLLSGGDFDNDGIPDEIDTDDDNDGMPDAFEELYGLNPLDASDASVDLDSDGLTNLEEYQLGTDPTDNDTDNDGILDGVDTIPNGIWVTGQAGNGGTISPTSVEVNSGSTTVFNLTPEEGYSVRGVYGCDGVRTGNTYTTSEVTSGCTVTALFKSNAESNQGQKRSLLFKIIAARANIAN